jgi:hypothetical protein
MPPPKNVDSDMFAKDASRVDMERWTAKSLRECHECEELGRRPRYLRYNVYQIDEMLSRSCAEWSEIANRAANCPGYGHGHPKAAHGWVENGAGHTGCRKSQGLDGTGAVQRWP